MSRSRFAGSSPPCALNGDQAEGLAVRLLHERGLVLIERNYRCRWGEIDLLMSEGRSLVVVEVRYRSHAEYGGALGSVDRLKLMRLRRTLACWLGEGHGQGYRSLSHCRIDVLALQRLPAPVDELGPPGDPPDLIVEDGRWHRMSWLRGVG